MGERTRHMKSFKPVNREGTLADLFVRLHLDSGDVEEVLKKLYKVGKTAEALQRDSAALIEAIGQMAKHQPEVEIM